MTDAELVALARSGDESAFRDLVTRHYAACWRYARAQTGHAADAEDVIQESLWSAYLALPNYHEEGRFRQWLFSILVNKVRNFQAARSRRDRTFPPLTSYDGVVGDASAHRDNDDEMSRAIAQLEPILREAVLLKHAEGLEYREMAAMTGVGESALKMRVKRGLEQLRAVLAASNGEHNGTR